MRPKRDESTAELLARQAATTAARAKAADPSGVIELSDLAALEPREVLALAESGRLANHGVGASRRGRR